MRNVKLGNFSSASCYSYGCMRLRERTQAETDQLLSVALDCGINTFDHADIYGAGKSEELFGQSIHNKVARDKIIIQSKCGICKGYFDFSYQHILESVEQSLSRLKTDYLDILLLHRPDTLIEPEEVAKAFEKLYSDGKVLNFGVSNHSAMQIELLKKHIMFPIIANQIQVSLAFTGLFDCGFNVNMTNSASVNHDGYLLDYLRANNISIQAWSPFQFGFFEGVFIANPKFAPLNVCLDKLSAKYDVTPSAIAVAWLNRHPANIQTILGTTNPTHLKEICSGSEIVLSREEWYELYRSAGNILP